MGKFSLASQCHQDVYIVKLLELGGMVSPLLQGLLILCQNICTYIERNIYPAQKEREMQWLQIVKQRVTAPFQAAWSLKAILICQEQEFWRGPQCFTVGEMRAGVFEIWRAKNLTLSQREERHRTSGPFLQATSERRTLQPLMLYPQFIHVAMMCWQARQKESGWSSGWELSEHWESALNLRADCVRPWLNSSEEKCLRQSRLAV